jgi:hypothetical protein
MTWIETEDYIQSEDKNSERTIVISENEGIHAGYGKVNETANQYVIQSYRFIKKNGWNMEKAKAWMDAHKFIIANRVSRKLMFNSIQIDASTLKTHDDGEYTVFEQIPITKCSVMNKALKPEDEIKKLCENSKPYRLFVTNGHPATQWGFVTGYDESLGWFGNFNYNEKTTQVFADIYVNKKYKEIIDNIKSGKTPEVSIGYFAAITATKGMHVDNISNESMEYDEIESDITLNHLAIGLRMNGGACSTKRGCGFAAALNEIALVKYWDEAKLILSDYAEKKIIVTTDNCIVKDKGEIMTEENKTEPIAPTENDKKDAENASKHKKTKSSIVTALNTFENETGMGIRELQLKRENEATATNWAEYFNSPISDIDIHASMKSDAKKDELFAKNIDVKITKNGTVRICSQCGTPCDTPACGVCNNDTYFINLTTETTTPSEAALKGTLVGAGTVEPAGQGTGQQNVSAKLTKDLTLEDLKENSAFMAIMSENVRLNKENFEYKVEQTKRESAELEILRNEVKTVLPKLTVDISKMSKNELNLILQVNKANVSEPTAKIAGMPTGAIDSAKIVANNGVDFAQKVIDNNKGKV